MDTGEGDYDPLDAFRGGIAFELLPDPLPSVFAVETQSPFASDTFSSLNARLAELQQARAQCIGRPDRLDDLRAIGEEMAAIGARVTAYTLANAPQEPRVIDGVEDFVLPDVTDAQMYSEVRASTAAAYRDAGAFDPTGSAAPATFVAWQQPAPRQLGEPRPEPQRSRPERNEFVVYPQATMGGESMYTDAELTGEPPTEEQLAAAQQAADEEAMFRPDIYAARTFYNSLVRQSHAIRSSALAESMLAAARAAHPEAKAVRTHGLDDESFGGNRAKRARDTGYVPFPGGAALPTGHPGVPPLPPDPDDVFVGWSAPDRPAAGASRSRFTRGLPDSDDEDPADRWG